MRTLQRDILKEATFLDKNGMFELALFWYNKALDIGSHAIVVGYTANTAQTRNLILSRVACLIKLVSDILQVFHLFLRTFPLQRNSKEMYAPVRIIVCIHCDFLCSRTLSIEGL